MFDFAYGFSLPPQDTKLRIGSSRINNFGGGFHVFRFDGEHAMFDDHNVQYAVGEHAPDTDGPPLGFPVRRRAEIILEHCVRVI